MSASRILRRVAGFAIVAFPASPAFAQLIAPRTVPIKQGEQFGIYPTEMPGLGGASIAVEDTLGDPWSNPAKATRLTSGWLQVTPFAHSATAGGGRSLPVSLMQVNGSWSGGMLFSLQELERRDVSAWNAPISDRRASNQYFAGMIARRLERGLSLGLGFSAAELRGVDGVTALYAGNDRVSQSGGLVDARLGVLKEYQGGASLEVVGVHHRFSMTHDVHYPATWTWPPCAACPAPTCTCDPITRPARDEHHDDRSNTSGVQAVFLAPRTPGGWRLGYLLTANRLSHPKLPDYQLQSVQSIPRDPGNTNAFNVGFGAARTMGHSVFAIDVVKEPMWSHTWADAARDTMDAGGVIIPRGAHTVDNRFRFSNSRINIGFSQDVPGATDSATAFGFQVGLAMRSINYTLDQSNHVTRTSRTQDEGWTEWTPTFAVRFRSRDASITYAISRTCGPDCGMIGGGDDVSVAPPADGGSVLAPPDGPLTFRGGSSGQHRLIVSIRLK